MSKTDKITRKKSTDKNGTRARAGADKKIPKKRGARRTGKREAQSRLQPVMILLIMVLASAVLILASLLVRRSGKTETDAEIVTMESRFSDKDKPETVFDTDNDTSTQEDVRQKGADLPDENNQTDEESRAEAVAAALAFLIFDESLEKLVYATVPVSVDPATPYHNVLTLLINGPPTSRYQTSIPSSTQIRSIHLHDSIVRIDLSSAFAEGAHGDIALLRINQILLTMKQFPEIAGIELKIDGRILETFADGRVYTWPLREPL